MNWSGPKIPPGLGKFFASLPNRLMEQLYDLYDQAVADRGALLLRRERSGVLLEDQRAHDGMLFAEAAGEFKNPPPSRRPRSWSPPSSTTASRVW